MKIEIEIGSETGKVFELVERQNGEVPPTSNRTVLIEFPRSEWAMLCAVADKKGQTLAETAIELMALMLCEEFNYVNSDTEPPSQRLQFSDTEDL